MTWRVGLASLVFALPMAIGLWTAKLSHQDDLLSQSTNVATRSVFLMDKLIHIAEKINHNALPLLNNSCEQAFPSLRNMAAFQPFIRSVNLVKNHELVCSSIVGQTLQPDESSLTENKLLLSKGNFVHPGEPILVVQTNQGHDAVKSVIDVETISFMLTLTDPGVHVWLHIGDNWLNSNGEFNTTPLQSPNKIFLEARSNLYPLSIYASVDYLSPWSALWATHKRMLSIIFIISLMLAWAVFWFTGRPRSPFGDLERGLRAREFVPYLQPIMDSQGKRLVGAEVLMRWQHPSGLITPELFIPQAESCGLIGPMTVQLMEIVGEALECHVTRLPAGFQVGFNISASHCKDDSLLHECRRFLNRFPQDSIRLVLELTEHEFFMDDAHSLELFRQLDLMGVVLAIDDFGTGHSSFSYLQCFHVDCLKIDKSFVNLIGKQSLSDHIIENIIDLANRLDLKLVAEGVETHEQAQYLETHGVHMMQGYLYGMPVPVNTFILEHSLADPWCKNCMMRIALQP